MRELSAVVILACVSLSLAVACNRDGVPSKSSGTEAVSSSSQASRPAAPSASRPAVLSVRPLVAKEKQPRLAVPPDLPAIVFVGPSRAGAVVRLSAGRNGRGTTASLSIRLADRSRAESPAIARVQVFEGVKFVGAVAAAESETFSFPASTEELQRVTIGGANYLLDARPGETFHVNNFYPGLWDLRGRPPTAG